MATLSFVNGIPPKKLWQKNGLIATDSANKNLTIAKSVSNTLYSVLPPPNHLLCKYHHVEGFERSNLAALTSLEKLFTISQEAPKVKPGCETRPNRENQHCRMYKLYDFELGEL